MTLRTHRLLLAGACFSMVLGRLPPAHAQDMTRADIALQDQVLELRHDLDQLRQQVAAGQHGNRDRSSLGGADAEQAAPPPGTTASGNMTASLYNQILGLQDQIRDLHGQIDDLRHAQTQMQADLGKQIADLTFRVQQLEGGAANGAAPTGANQAGAPAHAGTLGSAPPRHQSPPPASTHLSLAQGQAALARHDYPAAEQAARAALAAHTRTPAAARLLLARALSGQHDYQQAALAYDDLYNKDPKGAYGQDGLLGLAHSLAGLKDSQAACATLDKLHLTYPTVRPDISKAAASLGHRLACHRG